MSDMTKQVERGIKHTFEHGDVRVEYSPDSKNEALRVYINKSGYMTHGDAYYLAVCLNTMLDEFECPAIAEVFDGNANGGTDRLIAAVNGGAA